MGGLRCAVGCTWDEYFLDCRANEANERLGVGFGEEGDADDAAAGNETYEHR